MHLMPSANIPFIVLRTMASAPTENAAPRIWRVMVAEDNDAVRNVLVAWIKKEGMHVDEASNGIEAFALWKDAVIAFNVLITDHAMPLMNGLELVRRIRDSHIPAAEHLRVIVYSGCLDEKEAAAYRALRATSLIEKPTLPHHLIAAIRAQRHCHAASTDPVIP